MENLKIPPILRCPVELFAAYTVALDATDKSPQLHQMLLQVGSFIAIAIMTICFENRQVWELLDSKIPETFCPHCGKITGFIASGGCGYCGKLKTQV